MVERIEGETPQAKVRAYLHAVAKGDEAKAASMWCVPSYPDASRLEGRRKSTTRELIRRGISSFEIENVEWWCTCCEPRVIPSQKGAGGSRVRVRIVDGNGRSEEYTFDVFVPKGYWGEAAGYPVRHWKIVDVYAAGQRPIYWLTGARQ